LFKSARPPNNSNYRKKIDRISTGSKKLDDLLLGGIETHAITEFYGASSTGKTQLCHTLAVIATELEAVSKSLYVDTNGTFRPERIVSIARARGLDIAHTSANILYTRAMTSQHQQLFIEQLTSRIEKGNMKIRLLVVDSAIANYRAEFLGSSMLPERQQRLYRFMSMLSNIAQMYGIAVVVTNQINAGHSYTAKPIGGNIMAQASTYRISLRRLADSNRIVAKIVHGPYHPESETCFMLSEKGVEDL
jgi:DNA repair protein RadA